MRLVFIRYFGAYFLILSLKKVKLPNHRGILDGSGSTDDGHIESYTWEIISAPIGYQSTKLDTIMLHSSMLQLDNLDLPGNYTFKLTVTDNEQKSNSTTATIELLKEIDYPPNANAGTDIIVYYPQTNVTLNGSLSSDDHEITAWEWTKDSSTDQSKPVDMTLTRSPYLQLSNLEVGVYTFLLKVMDAKNQSSTSKVRVFVKPALTNEPNAVTGSNQTIILPQNWALLNGTESTDDVKIEKFEWKQLTGELLCLIECNVMSLDLNTFQLIKVLVTQQSSTRPCLLLTQPTSKLANTCSN